MAQPLASTSNYYMAITPAGCIISIFPTQITYNCFIKKAPKKISPKKALEHGSDENPSKKIVVLPSLH
jgi:hypothetical protein